MSTPSSERRLRRMVEQAQDLIYSCDAEGRFTYVNPAVTIVLKYEPDELLGRPFMSVIREDYRETMAALLARQIGQRIPNTYSEFVAVAKTGDAVWIGQHVQLVVDGDDGPGVQAIARDISPQKDIEERLRRSEAELRSLVQGERPSASTDRPTGRPDSRCESGAGPDARIRPRRRAAGAQHARSLPLAGGSRGASRDRRAPAARHRRGGVEEKGRHADSRAPRGPHRGRQRAGRDLLRDDCRRRDGTARAGGAAPAGAEDGGGRPAGARNRARFQQRAGRHHGVQRAHHQPSESRERRRAGCSRDSQDGFARRGAYTPVAAVQPQPGARAAGRGPSSGIREQRQHAEAAHGSARVGPRGPYRPPASRSHRAGPIRAGAAEPAGERAGRDARGGSITVRIDAVELGPRDVIRYPGTLSGSYARISVRDTGTGIDPDKQPFIFEPFFTTKTSEKGTGLGLSIVYGIAKDAGGMVTFATAAGKGTTFEVLLPLVLP